MGDTKHGESSKVRKNKSIFYLHVPESFIGDQFRIYFQIYGCYFQVALENNNAAGTSMELLEVPKDTILSVSSSKALSSSASQATIKV
jgi:hypothetical protein